MQHLIFDFTNTYPEDLQSALPGAVRIDMTDLSGTDMYCDDAAQEEILRRISPYGIRGIHLLDSGNYHYMTALLARQIAQPYRLVFFDHHTDCKSAMFDLLSCGSWAKVLLDTDPNLRKMILVGPPRRSMEELGDAVRSYLDPDASPRKLFFLPEEDLQERGTEALKEILREAAGQNPDLPLPVYLSIDKDILSETELPTNWDQGQISMELLEECLQIVTGDLASPSEEGKASDAGKGAGEKPLLLGADICGLLPLKDSGALACDPREMDTNLRLIRLLSPFFPCDRS